MTAGTEHTICLLFFNDQAEITEEELKKLRKKMREVQYPKWDERYNFLSEDQLKEIVRLLMAKIDAVRGRINSMKSSRIIYAESGALMNPSVQENAVFMPSMWTDTMQQQQPLAYYDTQGNMSDQRRTTMMMNNGPSCSQSTFGFDENPSSCAYICDENWVQKCGLGTGVMENVGANEGEPLMSYYVPCSQNGQCLLLSGAFPQMQGCQGGDYVQRHGFRMKNLN